MIQTLHTTASPDRVWAVLSDLRAWPEWLPTVDDAEPQTADRPDGVGASYVVRQPRLRPARWTVTEWQPGRGFTWESRSPGVVSVGRHELSPAPDGGTTITLAIEWSGGLAWLAHALFGRLTRRYLTLEAEALAARAESATTTS